MKLPKEGADGLPKDGFYWITLKVSFQGPKDPKKVKFGCFAAFCQFSQKRFDNFSLYFVHSFLGMDFIELFKKSFSR